jgi:excisionase family DNA binding protein
VGQSVETETREEFSVATAASSSNLTRYISQRRAAELADVDERTLRREIAAGRLRAYRVAGRSVRIRTSDFYTWLEGRPLGPVGDEGRSA